MRPQLLLPLTILLICCHHPDAALIKEIDQLSTLAAREAFLTKIFDDDQSVRSGNAELLKLNHGADSPEYKSYLQTQWDMDALNLKKVQQYLEKHGHPSSADSMNYKAMTAVWAVVHHSQTVKDRESVFEHLYAAYLKGDMKLDWLLKRMYHQKFRKKYENSEDNKYDSAIDQMIFELGLEEKAMRVKQELDL